MRPTNKETSWTNKRSEFKNRCTYLQSEVDRYLENVSDFYNGNLYID